MLRSSKEIMMMVFILGSAAWVSALFAAGYSHYRYRVRNNQMYQRRFGHAYTDGA